MLLLIDRAGLPFILFLVFPSLKCSLSVLLSECNLIFYSFAQVMWYCTTISPTILPSLIRNPFTTLSPLDIPLHSIPAVAITFEAKVN